MLKYVNMETRLLGRIKKELLLRSIDPLQFKTFLAKDILQCYSNLINELFRL